MNNVLTWKILHIYMYIIDNSQVNVGHKHIYIFFYQYSKALVALLAANNIHEKQCSLENQEQKQQKGPKGPGSLT